MGFFDSIKAIFGGGEGSSQESGYWIYVRCRRCGEVLKTRLDLMNNLSPRDEGGYVVHKTLVGGQLCFQRIEATLIFDDSRRLIDQSAVGGEFITAEEYEALSAEENG